MSVAFKSRCLTLHNYDPDLPSLLCAPYAGGGGSAYASWLNVFSSSGINLIGIRLPGRDDRIGEAPLLSIGQMVQEVHAALIASPLLGQPLHLFGHSMGASLAYELAQVLEQRSTPGFRSLTVSGANPPHLGLPRKRYGQMTDQQLLDEVSKLGGLPGELRQHPEFCQIVLQSLRPDLQAIEAYQFLSGPQLKCPMTILGGLQDAGVSKANLQRWSELTSGPSNLHTFQGGHFFVREQATQVASTIVRSIETNTCHG